MKSRFLPFLVAMFAFQAPSLRADEWVGLGPRAGGLDKVLRMSGGVIGIRKGVAYFVEEQGLESVPASGPLADIAVDAEGQPWALSSDGALLRLDSGSRAWRLSAKAAIPPGERAVALAVSAQTFILSTGVNLYRSQGGEALTRIADGPIDGIHGPFEDGSLVVTRSGDLGSLCAQRIDADPRPCGHRLLTAYPGCGNHTVLAVTWGGQALAGSLLSGQTLGPIAALAGVRVSALASRCDAGGKISEVLAFVPSRSELLHWTSARGVFVKHTPFPQMPQNEVTLVRLEGGWLIAGARRLARLRDGASAVEHASGSAHVRVDQLLAQPGGLWAATPDGPWHFSEGEWTSKDDGVDVLFEVLERTSLLDTPRGVLMTHPLLRWTGSSWLTIRNAPDGPIAHCGDGESLVAGGIGARSSTDSGETWREMSGGLPNTSDGRPIPIVAIHSARVGSRTYGAGTGGTLFVTSGCAEGWSRLPMLDLRAFKVAGIETPTWAENWVAVWSRTRGLFLSTDGGSSWREPLEGETSGVDAFTTDQLRPGIAYAFGGGVLFKSTDAGRSFHRMNESHEKGVRTMLIDPASPTQLLFGTETGVWAFEQSVPKAATLRKRGDRTLRILGSGFEDGVHVAIEGHEIRSVARVSAGILVVETMGPIRSPDLTFTLENPNLERSTVTLPVTVEALSATP